VSDDLLNDMAEPTGPKLVLTDAFQEAASRAELVASRAELVAEVERLRARIERVTALLDSDESNTLTISGLGHRGEMVFVGDVRAALADPVEGVTKSG
jgi:hypothetical protein